MRVMIIGATKFMGSFVIKRLTRMGHDVTTFHQGQSELLGDRTDFNALKDAIDQALTRSVAWERANPPGAAGAELDYTIRGHAVGQVRLKCRRHSCKGALGPLARVIGTDIRETSATE